MPLKSGEMRAINLQPENLENDVRLFDQDYLRYLSMYRDMYVVTSILLGWTTPPLLVGNPISGRILSILVCHNRHWAGLWSASSRLA